MGHKDEIAGLIAFLFEQDRKDHPPPGDLLSKILSEAKDKTQQSNRN